MVGFEGEKHKGQVQENQRNQDSNSSLRTMPGFSQRVPRLSERLQNSGVQGNTSLFYSQRQLQGFDEEFGSQV